MKNIDLKVVIGHYQEDLNWVNDLKYPYVIYNKNPENNGKYDFDLPNYGWDTIVYLTYIIDNYDNLPDYVCFSQDNPFDHYKDFVNKINNFDGLTQFLPLGKTYIRDNEDIVKFTKKYADTVGITYDTDIKFISGAQCIVSKELILKNNKEFYKVIKESIPKQKISWNINYYIEYLWPTIFNFNTELTVS